MYFLESQLISLHMAIEITILLDIPQEKIFSGSDLLNYTT